MYVVHMVFVSLFTGWRDYGVKRMLDISGQNASLPYLHVEN